jgi:phosphoserine phosphatase
MLNLIIQGADVATVDLKALAKLSGAIGIERLSDSAFRIRNARVDTRVSEHCAHARLDFAYVPAGRRLADFRLAVMDMDSTLISIECIDEIADAQGIKPEIAAITAAAMRGEIDYEQSLRRRVRLLRGLGIDAFDRVYRERLTLSPGAEAMLKAFRGAGIRTLLVSGGFRYFTERLKTQLALDFAHANEAEVVDGKLSGELIGSVVDAEGKARELRRIRDELAIGREAVIGIGDGANDLSFLAECAVSIAYHAKPAVRLATTHCLEHVGLEGVINLFE